MNKPSVALNPYPVSQDPMGGDAYPKANGPKDFDAIQKQLNQEQDDQQDAADALTKIPGKLDGVKDAYDRAIDSIKKYVEVTNAAAGAVDQSAGAQEKFKAEAQLTAAAVRAGTDQTDVWRQEMEKLATQAGAAADALAKAKIASEISRGSQTALLSPEDVTIANQLKGLYPDVATALNSVQASGMRTNQALSSLSSTVSSDLTTGLVSIETHSKSIGAAASQMGTQFETALDQMITKLLIVEPLMRQLQLGFSSLGLNFGGTINGQIGTFPQFATGTNSAPGGWSIVGENGPELMNLQPGATILPNGSSGGGNSGGGNNVQVNVINNASGTKATTSKRSEGGTDFHSIIISAVDQHAAGGGLDKVMKTRYATPMRAKNR